MPVYFFKISMVKIAESWRPVLADEFEKPYFQRLITFVKGEYATAAVYPAGSRIFHAFEAKIGRAHV